MHQVQQQTQVGRYALIKQISQFGERLAVSPVDHLDATITEGFRAIIKLVDADRICWYEVEEQSGVLFHKYTGCNRNAPLSPKVIPPGEMPYLAQRLGRHEIVALENLSDLTPAGYQDRAFLQELGVKSLLLIPSSYSQRRKGVLGVSSYSVEVNWPEEFIDQLATAANIIGATLERKDAQTAGQVSEERFRYLFAQASIGIAIETLQGSILDVNPAFCSMLGYPQEELMSLGCSRLTHPDDEAVEKILFEELRFGLRQNYRMEKRFFHKNGSHIWGQVSVSLLQPNQECEPLVIGMVSDITAQKMAEDSLYQRDRELQQLTRRLIEAQEEERSRISRELHDDLGQRVALLAIEVDLVRRLKSVARKQRASELIPYLHKELDKIATDIHEISHELHSASLQCCGLEVALKDLRRKYQGNHQLEIDLQTEKLNSKLSPEAALCLFRVAQEALANVQKHGQTKKVLVTVIQDSEKIRMTIKDFGVGFNLSTQSGGMGLISMRERLHFCSGELTVKSAPDQGTEIVAEVLALKNLAANGNT
jgi:PAS domain S-box-containing protein